MLHNRRLLHTVHGSARPVSADAFTLIELLVTIAVIAVLAAIIVPTIGRAGFRSKVARCTSNMRQLGIACASYSGEGEHVLPSFTLPTASSMSNYTMITPSMVAIETVSSLERFGMTPPMWFCPTRKRWNIAQNSYKYATGLEISSTADLINYYKLGPPVPGLDMFWWIPRKMEGFGGLTYPDPKLSKCRIPDGWPSRPGDANASAQPFASDWLVGTVNEETSDISEPSGGGHSYGGKIVNSNSVFVDGHVETRPFAALKWQMMGNGYGLAYFY